MAGTVDLVLKWTIAVVYAAAGALIGAAVAYVAVKLVLIALGAAVMSAKAMQAIVICAAIVSALGAAIGFIRQR